MLQQFQWNSVRRMSLPARAALIVFGAIVLLPIAIVIVLASLIAGLVFGFLMLVTAVPRKIISLKRNGGGRKNVRIKR